MSVSVLDGPKAKKPAFFCLSTPTPWPRPPRVPSPSTRACTAMNSVVGIPNRAQPQAQVLSVSSCFFPPDPKPKPENLNMRPLALYPKPSTLNNPTQFQGFRVGVQGFGSGLRVLG